ncbi:MULTISPECIES: DUF6230 family protein [Kitasatospora]|uniref:DUF6230 family protein n=1 Tax=Kitasatospora TaxID=2063 RepID=UPI000C2C9654|nr:MULTISPECIES: DUF6230 family protein [Kitasatospora]RAJ34516.1 hypothetical protein K353_05330 [Kitasatospora sp. SolWspMP-SS2h]
MSQSYGKTRWKRFALVMVPSIAATAAIGVSLANSALAASFSVSGQQFKVTVDDLQGEGFSQFGGVDVEKNGTPHPVAVSAFDHATLKNLCQSVVTDLGPLGKWTLVLNAGQSDDKAKQVDAQQLLIDLNQLNADAEFKNINIGQDAGTLKGSAVKKLQDDGGTLPTGAQGFAQAADSAHLQHVQQTAWATSAGTFTLNGLKLNINKGSGAGVECY